MNKKNKQKEDMFSEARKQVCVHEIEYIHIRKVMPLALLVFLCMTFLAGLLFYSVITSDEKAIDKFIIHECTPEQLKDPKIVECRYTGDQYLEVLTYSDVRTDPNWQSYVSKTFTFLLGIFIFIFGMCLAVRVYKKYS